MSSTATTVVADSTLPSSSVTTSTTSPSVSLTTASHIQHTALLSDVQTQRDAVLTDVKHSEEQRFNAVDNLSHNLETTANATADLFTRELPATVGGPTMEPLPPLGSVTAMPGAGGVVTGGSLGSATLLKTVTIGRGGVGEAATVETYAAGGTVPHSVS